MTLATHAIAGAVVARLVPQHPFIAFTAGFLSHFLLDAIPHWDYHLRSYKSDESNPLNNDMVFGLSFTLDLLDIGFDLFLALFVPFVIFGSADFNATMMIIFGIFGGILPDALQFVYMKFRHEPLVSLQKFHIWMHSKRRIHDWKLGVAAQFAFCLFLIFISFKISS